MSGITTIDPIVIDRVGKAVPDVRRERSPIAFCPMPEHQLLTYREIADRFGITPDGARMLVKRRGWHKKPANSPGGSVRIEVPIGDAPPEQEFAGGNTGNIPTHSPEHSGGHSPAVPTVVPPGSEVVPLVIVDLLRADHARQLADRDRQQDQMRSDHAAEMARMSSLHLDLIGRIQAQASAERGLFLERVDAAELRAEAAEARAAAVDEKLHQVLDRLLERPLPTTPAPEPPQPWWARWFGQTKRSDIGG